MINLFVNMPPISYKIYATYSNMILNLSFMRTHISTTDMTLRETQYPHLGTPVIDCSAVTSYIKGKENIINKDFRHIPRQIFKGVIIANLRG